MSAMKKMTLNSVKKNNETIVSNVFLDNYMKDANGEFVKVYLYLLRCMSETAPAVTVSDIADRLNLTEKDVIRALKYWAKVNVLAVEFDAESKEPSSITFLPLEPVQIQVSDAATIERPIPAVKPQVSQPAAPQAEPATGATASHSYSPAYIKKLKEREDIKQLLYIVEKYIGKPLSTTDMGTILYINETLGFTPELIEYLVEYCVTNNHTSLRYMEKVALAWHDKGITSVGEAKDVSAIRNTRVAVVSKTFGIGDRSIVPAEMEFITKWYDEYGFDKEMVEEACRRTIMTMSKPNFSYADGILKKWRSAKIHTMDDLKKLDAGFRAKITVPVTNKPVSKSVNKFNNFSQRTYNFEEMEKNLISNNK